MSFLSRDTAKAAEEPALDVAARRPRSAHHRPGREQPDGRAGRVDRARPAHVKVALTCNGGIEGVRPRPTPQPDHG